MAALPVYFKKDKNKIVEYERNNEHFGFSFHDALTEHKVNREILLEAFEQFGATFHDAATEHKANREIVLEAVRNVGASFHDAAL